MRPSWRDLGRPRADNADGKSVEIAGFALTSLSTGTDDHCRATAKLLGGNYRRVFEASIDYDPPAGRPTEILLIPI